MADFRVRQIVPGDSSLNPEYSRLHACESAIDRTADGMVAYVLLEQVLFGIAYRHNISIEWPEP
jgi:hypothetical protein